MTNTNSDDAHSWESARAMKIRLTVTIDLEDPHRWLTSTPAEIRQDIVQYMTALIEQRNNLADVAIIRVEEVS